MPPRHVSYHLRSPVRAHASLGGLKAWNESSSHSLLACEESRPSGVPYLLSVLSFDPARHRVGTVKSRASRSPLERLAFRSQHPFSCQTQALFSPVSGTDCARGSRTTTLLQLCVNLEKLHTSVAQLNPHSADQTLTSMTHNDFALFTGALPGLRHPRYVCCRGFSSTTTGRDGWSPIFRSWVPKSSPLGRSATDGFLSWIMATPRSRNSSEVSWEPLFVETLNHWLEAAVRDAARRTAAGVGTRWV